MNDTPENITISVKFATLNEIIITDIFIIEMAMEIFLFFLYVFLLMGKEQLLELKIMWTR